MTPCPLSTDETAVLQLGLGFCPADPIHITETIKDLYLFARNLTFKFIYDKERHNINLERELSERTQAFTMDEFRALRDLMLLYDEGSTDDCRMPPVLGAPGTIGGPSLETPSLSLPKPPPSKFKPRSRRFPDLSTCPVIWAFLQQTIKDIKQNQWRTFHPNLTLNQQTALLALQRCSDIVIKPSDKGGNIVIMTHSQYRTMCHTVLSNHAWYTPIAPTRIQMFIEEFRDMTSHAYFLYATQNPQTIDTPPWQTDRLRDWFPNRSC